ncbi:MAG: response regulator [Clostridia bacterium]|nr:response regulator [Clostridia bacterium]
MKKIRLLIVDDEPYMRESICVLLEEAKARYEIVADCFSGEIALNIIKKNEVDIVISDIKMPKMSGIELLKEAHKIKPAVQFIMLSAYNDFDFIREAFRCGAVDYIMKTELNYETLIAALDATVERLENSGGSIVKASLLRALALGSNNQKKILSDLEQFGFVIDKYALRLMALQITDFETNIEQEFDCDETLITYGLSNIFNEVLQETRFQCDYVYMDSGQFVFFLMLPKKNNESEWIREITGMFHLICSAIKEFLNCSVSVGISSYFWGGKSIGELYREACIACDMSFFNVREVPIFFKKEFLDSGTGITFLKTDELRHALNSNWQGDISEIAPKLVIDEQKLSVHDIEKSRAVYDNYYFLILECSKTLNLYMYVKDDLDYYNLYLKKWGRLYEINDFVMNMILTLTKMKKKTSGIVRKIIEYVIQNYDKDISLNDLGNEFKMNPNYLSMLLKREMHQGFAGFLIKIRLEKAIELMKEKKYNITEISAKCGFNNVEHFSRSFKKFTNESPKKFYDKL